MIDQLPAYLSYVLGATLTDLLIWLIIGTMAFTLRRVFARYTKVD